MGFRFSKSIRIAKGVRLNLSKSGIGVSAGVKGFRVGTGPRGTKITASIPGTGMSYSQTLGSGKQQSAARSTSLPSYVGSSSAQVPSPGIFAPGKDKQFCKALKAFLRGDNAEALTILRPLAEKDPYCAVLAATLLIERQNFAVALSLLEAMVGADEFDSTDYIEKYATQLASTISITPQVSVTVAVGPLAGALLLAELYQQEHRTEDAITILEDINETIMEPCLVLSLCELYTEVAAWDGIISLANRVSSEDDVTLQTMIFHARALSYKGLNEAASSILTEALRKKKNRHPELLTEARYWRGRIYEQMGKKSMARKDFELVFSENPQIHDVSQRLNSQNDFALSPSNSGGVEAGFFNGRHYTSYVEEVKQLKRDDRLEEAKVLLEELVAVVNAEAQANKAVPAPWYAEHLGIVERRLAKQSQTKK